MYIQNKQDTAITKHFSKPQYTHTNCGTIFSADIWKSDGQVIFHAYL